MPKKKITRIPSKNKANYKTKGLPKRKTTRSSPYLSQRRSKTKEELERDIETGDADEDIYTDAGREIAEEDDAITDVEAGVMEGFEEDEAAVKCANCKKILEEDFIEEELGGELLRFCSEQCARDYENKL